MYSFSLLGFLEIHSCKQDKNRQGKIKVRISGLKFPWPFYLGLVLYWRKFCKKVLNYVSLPSSGEAAVWLMGWRGACKSCQTVLTQQHPWGSWNLCPIYIWDFNVRNNVWLLHATHTALPALLFLPKVTVVSTVESTLKEMFCWPSEIFHQKRKKRVSSWISEVFVKLEWLTCWNGWYKISSWKMM